MMRFGLFVIAACGSSAPPATTTAPVNTVPIVTAHPTAFTATMEQLDVAQRWTIASGARKIELTIPNPSAGVAYTGNALSQVERCSNEWDREFAMMANALLPFENLVLHVGSEKFCDGASYFDMHVRVYVLPAAIDELEPAMHTAGTNMLLTLAHDGNFRELGPPRDKFSTVPGWTSVQFVYPRWYGDYGRNAFVETYLRRFGDVTVALMILTTSDQTYVADGVPVDPIGDIIKSVRAR